MSILSSFRHGLRRLLHSRTVERELDDELAHYTELAIEERVRHGMTPREAARGARLETGSQDAAKEVVRGFGWEHVIETVWRDAIFALRRLRRRPTFALIAVSTVALGIGAATSIYSVVDGVLLRPLPFRDPGRLVAVWQTINSWKTSDILGSMWDHVPLSIPHYLDLSRRASTLDGVAIWTSDDILLTDGEQTARVRTYRVSASVLDVLGLRPALGRMIRPEEAVPGGPQVAMISYEAWQGRYGGAPDILGTTIHYEGGQFQIVGVLPRGLSLGRLGAMGEPANLVEQPPVFWRPAGQDSASYTSRFMQNYTAIARVKRGVTLAEATADVDTVLNETAGERAGRSALVLPWKADQTRTVRGPLVLLLGGVVVLLLIACVNVAMLLIGEAFGREQEIGARLVLGATRRRVVGQLLIESVILTAVGATIGVALAAWGTRILVAVAPPGMPGLTGVHMDVRVLSFAIVLTGATGIVVGLAPALMLSDSEPGVAARAGAGHSGRGRAVVQRWTIAGQTALSVTLLVAAALLVQTLDRITRVDPGFRPDRLETVELAFPLDFMRDSLALQRFRVNVPLRLAGLPGVSGVTGVSLRPFAGMDGTTQFGMESDMIAAPGGKLARSPTARPRQVQWRVILPNYFDVLGVRVRAGRAFNSTDGLNGDGVAIVSTALVQRDFGGRSPVGRRIFVYNRWLRVVGVVDDIHLRQLSSPFEATLYTPYTQPGVRGMTLVVRTTGDPAAETAAIRRAIAETEPRAVVTTIETTTSAIGRSYADERFRATLMSVFASLATVLAAVGLYGVTSRSVSRRSREMAIRSALGASRTTIVRTLLGATASGVLIGISAGELLAILASAALSPYLYGLTPTDFPTHLAVLSLLVAVCTFASAISIRANKRLDIAAALRVE